MTQAIEWVFGIYHKEAGLRNGRHVYRHAEDPAVVLWWTPKLNGAWGVSNRSLLSSGSGPDGARGSGGCGGLGLLRPRPRLPHLLGSAFQPREDEAMRQAIRASIRSEILARMPARMVAQTVARMLARIK